MTAGEIQVGPRRARNFAEARSYRDAIRHTCTILLFTEAAADLYAEIRETPAIRSPDAIQLSCAASAGIDLFITNDRGLQRLTVPGIDAIASLDRLSL